VKVSKDLERLSFSLVRNRKQKAVNAFFEKKFLKKAFKNRDAPLAHPCF